MLLLGVDTETTGLLVLEDRIIELGAVLWDTDRNIPVQIYSSLVQVPHLLKPEITKITGITDQDLVDHGDASSYALVCLLEMARKAEAIVAHNGTAFDRPLIEAELVREGLEIPQWHWIDTMLDVPFPESIKSRSLPYLAADHGFVNPFPHRAVTDVLTMMRVLSLYNVAEVLKTSHEPNVILQAMVKAPWQDPALDGKKESDKAKARGFRFHRETKQWLKTLKQSAVLGELKACEFSVRELQQ